MRYAQSGLTFLRWLDTRVVYGEEWREFLASVPAHWADEIAALAKGCAENWKEVARELEHAAITVGLTGGTPGRRVRRRAEPRTHRPTGRRSGRGPGRLDLFRDRGRRFFQRIRKESHAQSHSRGGGQSQLASGC